MQLKNMPDQSLQERIIRLESCEQIRNLAARYCTAVDDHDLRQIGDLFTRDACFSSKDGVMRATGREDIVAQFVERFRSLGISNHVGHDHIIEIDPDSLIEASGRVSSHAEMWRNGRVFIAAMRYTDRYRRDADQWRFQSRELHFLYYVPVTDYAEALGSPLRQRAYGDERPADYPESLSTWTDFRNFGEG